MCLKQLLVKATPLRDFETYADLEAWYELHNELRMDSPNLCDDYSREARALAEADGYFLSCELVHAGKCYGVTIFRTAEGNTDESVYHIGNMAIVNEEAACYYVDLNVGILLKLCSFYTGGKYP